MPGVVGVSDVTLVDLLAKLPAAIREMVKLNGQPDDSSHIGEDTSI